MKKIGLICLAIVLALGGLGVGFALWSETLVIDATVEAGEVDVIFVSYDPGPPFEIATTNDPRDNDPAEFGRNPARRDKNVGDSSLGLRPDGSGVILLIHNSYPSYYTTGWAPIKNIGTVPVKIQNFQMKIKAGSVSGWKYSDDGGTTWTEVPPDTWEPFAACTTRLVDLDKDGDADYSVHIVNPAKGTQIDPDGVVWMDIDVHVEQGAEQGQGWIQQADYSYVFYISMQAVQWNEYTP